jgi:hypothetical protein
VLKLKATHAGALEERTRCTKGQHAMEGAKLMLEQLQRTQQRDSPALQAQLSVVMDTSPECTEARLMQVDALFTSGDYGCAPPSHELLKARGEAMMARGDMR